MEDPIQLLNAAVADAAPNYTAVTADDLDRPTPCDGWDLRALLNHVLSRVALSTTAAQLGETTDFAAIEVDYVGTDPAAAFTRMTGELLAAWAACDDLTTDRVTPLGPIPPQGVLLFGAQDIFIHAWDVARARGVEPQLSDAMIEVFTATHHQSVDEQTRTAFFGDEIAMADDAPALDKLVGFLGRQP